MPRSPENDQLVEEGRALVDDLKAMNLEMVRGKRRLELMFEDRASFVEDRRNAVQETINQLESTVSKDRAIEEDEVEYVLALFERLELDEEYVDLREAVGLLNLPVEADNLSGELGEVNPSPEEADVET